MDIHSIQLQDIASKDQSLGSGFETVDYTKCKDLCVLLNCQSRKDYGETLVLHLGEYEKQWI